MKAGVVVGLGLIGGSLARDLGRAGWRVIGVDRPAIARRARRLGVVAATAPTLERALRAASPIDLLVLAAPPRANLALLRRAAALRPAPLAITDTGSVKGAIVREAERLGLRTFVGGHPMAGSERSGLAASREGLFRGCPWILTPPATADARALRVTRAMVRATGARARTLDASTHDRAVAFLSHLPQVVAWALAGAAQADPVARRHLDLAGPGFRDMTRLARSPRGLWREILAENAPELRRALRAFVTRSGLGRHYQGFLAMPLSPL